MSKNKNIVGVIAAIVLAVLIGLEPEVLKGIPLAAAQAGTSGPPSTMVSGMVFFVGLVITILNFLAWFVFMMLDLVMDPEWIFNLQSNGADGSLMNMIREIWQLCRDLVNIGLALVLIFEAIMMIIKSDGSKIKEMLPKFLIALVAVNFSWFIPRAIFDFSQVMTYSAYQVPSILRMDACSVPPRAGQTTRQPCQIVREFLFFEDTDQLIQDGAPGRFRRPGDAGAASWTCPLEKIVCIRMVDYDSPEGQGIKNQSKIINGIVVNYAQLRNLINITDPRPANGGPIGRTTTESLWRLASYLIKLFVALLVQIAVLFPLLAMTTAFFLRIPIMWVTMGLMPLVALGFVVGDKMGDFNPMKLIWEQFLSAVFLPLKLAIPFSISFILLNAGSTSVPPNEIVQLTRPFSVFAGIRDMWQILWMIIAIYILWKYSFQILKKDEIMGMFVDKIEGMGKSLGNIAWKIPANVPILPAPGGGQMSLMGASRAFDLRQIDAELGHGNRDVRQIIRERSRMFRPAPAPGGAGGAPSATASRLTSSNEHRNTLNTRLPTLALAPSAAEKTRILNETMQQLRKTDTDLTRVTNRELIDAIIQASRSSHPNAESHINEARRTINESAFS